MIKASEINVSFLSHLVFIALYMEVQSQGEKHSDKLARGDGAFFFLFTEFLSILFFLKELLTSVGLLSQYSLAHLQVAYTVASSSSGSLKEDAIYLWASYKLAKAY